MAAATTASRVLGFVKATFLVYAIGGTSAAVGGQAFEVASSAPINLFNLLAGGVLSAILVPQIVRSLRLGNAGREQIDRLVTVALVGGAVIAAVLTLAAPFIVWVYAASWSAAWLDLATAMAYWCLPQVFFLVVFAVFSQLLNAQERFSAAAWAPALSNVIGIVGIIVFLVLLPSGLGPASSWSPVMVAVLCGSATLGIVAQAALVVVAAARSGTRIRFRRGFGGLGHLGGVAVWTLFSVAAGQGAYVIVSNVAAAAGERLYDEGIVGASLNSLSLAYLIVLVPHGVFVVAIATAVYARISHAAAGDDHESFGALTQRTAVSVTWVIVLTTAGMVVLGPTLSELIWDSPVIGQVVAVLAAGSLGFSQAFLVNRASFALGDGRGPFYTQLTIAAVTATGALLAASLLPAKFVVIGIACGISIANYLGWAVAARFAYTRLRQAGHPPAPWRTTVIANGRLIVAGLLAGGAGLLALYFLPAGDWLELLVALFVVAIIITVLYATTAWVLADRTLETLRRSR